jgi:RNA polymerase sigma-70 factor (ECF subfamily)
VDLVASGESIGSGLVIVSRSAAFAAFYEREYRSAVTLATVLLGDPQRAADLAQEIFTIALRRWAKIATYDRPDLWVRRAIINRAISERRKRASESRALARLAVAQSGVAPIAVDQSGVWRSVGMLPRRQAQALALVYGDDMSIEDAAQAMRCSAGSVKTHLHRGRAALAVLWRQTDDR